MAVAAVAVVWLRGTGAPASMVDETMTLDFNCDAEDDDDNDNEEEDSSLSHHARFDDISGNRNNACEEAAADCGKKV
eukprot:CAMPEP_0175083444 /NCGR_PEP_ID=MMETSP0052_2-20121109/27389_1 /TAXON_ID=51329 ORGANISM="Polytomella parva, Strain SAG 63-3" /NCGR_SAMPLE_ID=MMETSP0052_2 /ASSEMBLY_ACC=CAM_ASM_000194 /LENGTH=76 /DNA_ID=CAMNT_0016354901 /DNA_START=554 /DNA_END=783 /DNA_ORIENTATION=-